MNGQAIRRGCVLASALFALGSVGTVAAQSGPSDLHQEDAPARHHFFVAVDNDNWEYCARLAGAAEHWKDDPEFENVTFMSVHFKKEKGHAFWNLATQAHNDNPIPGFGPEVIGTPYGVMDGGHIFFRGYEDGEAPYLADLRRMQERTRAGASLESDFYFSPQGELIVAVSITSHLDFVLNAENEARINVGLLERKREPYFSISATTQQAGGLCGVLEPGDSLRCGVSLGKLNPGVFAKGAEVFVALTYRPDAGKESHDSVQSGMALAEPDMRPTLIHIPYVGRRHSRWSALRIGRDTM